MKFESKYVFLWIKSILNVDHYVKASMYQIGSGFRIVHTNTIWSMFIMYFFYFNT